MKDRDRARGSRAAPRHAAPWDAVRPDPDVTGRDAWRRSPAEPSTETTHKHIGSGRTIAAAKCFRFRPARSSEPLSAGSVSSLTIFAAAGGSVVFLPSPALGTAARGAPAAPAQLSLAIYFNLHLFAAGDGGPGAYRT